MSWHDKGLADTGSVQGISVGPRQQLAKRGNEEHNKEAGTKKGRSAFGDLTNREGHEQVLPAPNDKAEQKVEDGKQQENVLGRFKLLGRYQGVQEEQKRLPDPSDDLLDMEYEACSPSACRLWKDIDKEDRNSPLAVAYYANDIMNSLFKSERRRRPQAKYMEFVQPDITAQMRGILVDWLVEVAQEYKLVTETLYLTVSYVDRYLTVVPVQRNYLQLVGVTCMLVASKYEEIYAPQVDEFCFITENTYTREEILATERRVLDALDFELTAPTVRVFLRRFVKAAAASCPGGKPDHRLDLLSSYLAELTLLEYQAVQYLPSMIAASAVLLAQFCLSKIGWNPTLQHYSSYTARDLKPCVTMLHRCFQGARTSELPAIRDKYNQPKCHCVAALQPPCLLPHSLFI